jgi:hypothetical protein
MNHKVTEDTEEVLKLSVGKKSDKKIFSLLFHFSLAFPIYVLHQPVSQNQTGLSLDYYQKLCLGD